MSFLVGVPGKLTTLLSRLSSARAGYLDYINTLYGIWTSTLATNLGTTNTSVATLLSRLTSDRCDNLDDVGNYTYVQRGRVTWANTDYSENVTITAVVMNRSHCRISAKANATVVGSLAGIAGAVSGLAITARLTSTTNLEISRRNDTTHAVIIDWEVIEDKAP